MQPTQSAIPTGRLTSEQLSQIPNPGSPQIQASNPQNNTFDWNALSQNTGIVQKTENAEEDLGNETGNIGEQSIKTGGASFANDVGQTIAMKIMSGTNSNALPTSSSPRGSGTNELTSFDQLPKIDQTNVSNLFQMMHTATTQGNTALATHFADAIKNYQMAKGETLADAFPVLNKSPEQIVGDAVGAATTAATLGAGSLLDAAGVATEAGTTAANATRGALVGANAGLGAGVASGLENNENATGIAKSGLEGEGTGIALGGLTGGLEENPSGSAAESQATPKTSPEDTIQKNPQKILDATNPEENGKAKIKAYKDVVTGNRTGGETGMLKTQGLDPGTDAVKLSSRLNDIPGYAADGNTHLDNLKALGNNLDTTESKIDEVTSNDTTTGTKEGLKSELENLKENRPTEFKIKGDNSKLYNKVIDFAKSVVDKNDENTKGFRDGRTEFDNQAKREFPSAFKPDGSIDTTKPAGAAIKSVRDTYNKYTYDNSSRGEELRGHIQREADIFRAANNIAPKAAAQDGETIIDRFMDTHPGLKRGANLAERIGMRTVAGTAARGIMSGIKAAFK